MDYRKMYDDKEYLYAFDLEGCPRGEDGKFERTLKISGCSRVELTGDNNKKAKKPGVSFYDEPKKLALNKTNGKVIAKLYGKDTDRWVGESITIFATTTEFGGETRDCIRVRPQRPERGEPRRSPSEHQGSDNTRRRTAKEAKTDQAAAESSAVSARYLIGEYEKCDSDEKLAELKVARGRAWSALSETDRKAIGEAALAAKARIDAAAAAGNGTSAPANDGKTDSHAPGDDADDDQASDDSEGTSP
jgi:hypothetical protein